jgi:hypothetical protein
MRRKHRTVGKASGAMAGGDIGKGRTDQPISCLITVATMVESGGRRQRTGEGAIQEASEALAGAEQSPIQPHTAAGEPAKLPAFTAPYSHQILNVLCPYSDVEGIVCSPYSPSDLLPTPNILSPPF